MSGPRPSAEDPTLRILIADDNALLRDTLDEWLTHNGGVEVAALASSASEAVMMIEAASPDVAILDMRMPDMDGLEVARHIAARHPEVAVILYTSEEAAPILDVANPKQDHRRTPNRGIDANGDRSGLDARPFGSWSSGRDEGPAGGEIEPCDMRFGSGISPRSVGSIPRRFLATTQRATPS